MTYSGILSPERIEHDTGFSLGVIFIDGPQDGAALASYHDEHERLVKQLGWENVFGSLCVNEDRLVLGIFIRKNNVIEGDLVTHELSSSVLPITTGHPEIE